MFFDRIPRLPWDARWMFMAHYMATCATCDRGPELLLDPGRHGVGAVIVRDERPIGMGYNGAPPGVAHCDEIGHIIVSDHCVATIHAERNAILQCALDETSPEDATLYTTASPCWDCANVILRCGLKRVVIGTDYNSRYELSESVEKRLRGFGVDVDRLDIREYLI